MECACPDLTREYFYGSCLLFFGMFWITRSRQIEKLGITFGMAPIIAMPLQLPTALPIMMGGQDKDSAEAPYIALGTTAGGL